MKPARLLFIDIILLLSLIGNSTKSLLSAQLPAALPALAAPPTTMINNFQFTTMSAAQNAELTTELVNRLASAAHQNTAVNQQTMYSLGVEQLKQLSAGTLNFLKTHKLRCCLSVIAAGYLYSLYGSYRLLQRLEQPDQLAHWKSSCDLNQLLATPQSVLVADLDQFIKLQYEAFFKAEIEHELALAQRYLHYAQVIQQLRLTRFYPISPTRIKQVEAQVSRLSYLKQLFQTWQQTHLALATGLS